MAKNFYEEWLQTPNRLQDELEESRLVAVDKDRLDAPENVQKIAAIFFDNPGMPPRNTAGADHNLIAGRGADGDQRAGHAANLGISCLLSYFKAEHATSLSANPAG